MRPEDSSGSKSRTTAPIRNSGRIPDTDRRASERLLMDVPLLVRADAPGDQAFQEETFTVSVSAHGALVMLASRVEVGQTISLVNLQTHAETRGRVARLGSPHGGLAQVGVEFEHPAPEFWHLESLPPSWKSAQA